MIIAKIHKNTLTSSTNGIEGPPFMFFGFKRGNSASLKAFPALLSFARKVYILVPQEYVRTYKELTGKLVHSGEDLPVIVEYKNIFLHCNCP